MSQSGCQRSSVQYPRKGRHHKNQKSIPYPANAFFLYMELPKDKRMVGQGSAHQHGYGHGHFIRVAYECWVLTLRWLAGRFCKLVQTNGMEICLVTNNDFNKRVLVTDSEWVSLLIGWIIGEKKEFGAEVNSNGRRCNVKSSVCISFVRFCKHFADSKCRDTMTWTIHTNQKWTRSIWVQKSECCFHGKICHDISCRDNSTSTNSTKK
jgi:hypothetical protein